jgi:hypothetical protein
MARQKDVDLYKSITADCNLAAIRCLTANKS